MNTPRIVVIGNSAAGFSACATLAKATCPLQIVVVSQEEFIAYRKDFLLDYLAQDISRDKLFLCAEGFYGNNKIEFLKNTKVVRIDTKRQAVVSKDNSRIDYDYLIIATGYRVNIPDIPGNAKDGVFAVDNLGAVEQIRQRMALSDTVCVSGDANLCWRILEILRRKNKEVKVIARPRLDAYLPEEKTEWIEDLDLQEIIGEGSELKAVKLSNGKVFGVGMVLFVGNYRPQSDFLKDSKIAERDGYIQVDDLLRTNLENIFACGAVCQRQGKEQQIKTWEEATQEGTAVANNLLSLLERGKTICQQMS